ncbi:MAG TPA: hypothetical protein DCQ64_29180 [Candidatus Rokubacteria bacterium]|nr:hypothetical protein [Candidatus Rokubacteria bacterium]
MSTSASWIPAAAPSAPPPPRPLTRSREGLPRESRGEDRIHGHCVGGIGVSGGTGEQDVEVARAGLGAFSPEA